IVTARRCPSLIDGWATIPGRGRFGKTPCSRPVDFAVVRDQTLDVVGKPVSARVRRPLVVAAAIAALVAVVALASRPGGTLATVAGPAMARTALDSVFYLLVALGVIEG